MSRSEKQGIRSGNTYAMRTKGIKLDWLTATLPTGEGVWAGLEEHLGTLTLRGGGWHGWYNQSWIALDSTVLVAVQTEAAKVEAGHLGGHDMVVDIKGAGCDALGDKLWPFIGWLYDRGAQVTRADWALDDTVGYLTDERVNGAVDSGRAVTQAKSTRLIQEQETTTGKVVGMTRYFGTRRSVGMLRIYDKRQERIAKGEQVHEPHWFRVELESRKQLADALVRSWFERGFESVLAEIGGRLRFVQESETDTNRRRWPLTTWWRAFIGDLSRFVRVVVERVAPESTIERMRETLELQGAPRLAVIVMADGGSLEQVYEMIENGKRRLRPYHLAALEAAYD